GEYARGHAKHARADADRSVQYCRQHGNQEFAAVVRAIQADLESELGYDSDARQHIAEALQLAPDKDTKSIVAMTMPRVGDAARAQKFKEEIAAQYPTDTLLNKVQLAVVQATIDIQKNQPDAAI